MEALIEFIAVVGMWHVDFRVSVVEFWQAAGIV
jgi:hypothetical protein